MGGSTSPPPHGVVAAAMCPPHMLCNVFFCVRGISGSPLCLAGSFHAFSKLCKLGLFGFLCQCRNVACQFDVGRGNAVAEGIDGLSLWRQKACPSDVGYVLAVLIIKLSHPCNHVPCKKSYTLTSSY